MKVETFQAMGAVPVKDGIVFSMERKNNEEASLLLYKKGFLSAIPADGGSIIVMLVPILGTMAFAYATAKKKGKEPVI